jgi:hypothetical protein
MSNVRPLFQALRLDRLSGKCMIITIAITKLCLPVAFEEKVHQVLNLTVLPCVNCRKNGAPIGFKTATFHRYYYEKLASTVEQHFVN